MASKSGADCPKTWPKSKACPLLEKTMSIREANSARTENFSLYTSLTASRGKDFELCEDDLPETTASVKSEDLNPPLSSSFVVFHLPPLHEAAERGDFTAVTKLLSDKNIDVNEKAGGHRAHRTALHRAAGYGHLEVVKVLLKVRLTCKIIIIFQSTSVLTSETQGKIVRSREQPFFFQGG